MSPVPPVSPVPLSPVPLTDAQLEELRQRLHAMALELGLMMDRSRDGAGPVSLDEPIGRLSRMDAMQQQKMVQASRARGSVRLAQIAAALTALREGEYGECRDCGEDIGFRRLSARPETPFCLACQSRRETVR